LLEGEVGFAFGAEFFGDAYGEREFHIVPSGWRWGKECSPALMHVSRCGSSFDSCRAPRGFNLFYRIAK
jgi:hypothetical protein